MDFKNFIKKSEAFVKQLNENSGLGGDTPDNSIDNVVNSVQKKNSVGSLSEQSRLFAINDPETGEKYDIPLLSRLDPDYYFKYVYYMRLKENSPGVFEQIMGWE